MRFVMLTVIPLGFLLFLYGQLFDDYETNMDERRQYWEHEIASGLPSSTPKESVFEFFSKKGVKLECCTYTKDGSKVYYGEDPAALARVGKHELTLRILVPIVNDALAGKVELATLPTK